MCVYLLLVGALSECLSLCVIAFGLMWVVFCVCVLGCFVGGALFVYLDYFSLFCRLRLVL